MNGEAHVFLQTLALLLCAAAVTTVVFQRLRQPVVLGYLLAGIVIGPRVTIAPNADPHVVHTLAELGVILLMFSLGIEFSLKKLLRVGATAGFVAVVQCSFMVWLGYLVTQAYGWSRLESIYAGAVISISSTTIIVKAFEEQRVKAEFTHVVFGVLIVEDLIAILLITMLTTLSQGEQLTATQVMFTIGRLGAFLAIVMIVGLLTVPRMMRTIVSLDRAETTVVASVGIAFGLAYLASAFEYSVALGAFIAGSLVAESGVEHRVEHLVQPVRDIFAAIFFVSVGMLIDPAEIVNHWVIVMVFLLVVVVGKISSVTISAFLTGQSVQTSVKSGMSLAQIGEFSFIIAGAGMVANGDNPTFKLLYSIAVAVSGITTLLTPWLIRAAQPTAAYVDRKLPRALQTFVALYGSWLEQLKSGSADEHRARVRGLIRWLIVDTVVLAAIIIGVSVQMDNIRTWAEKQLTLPEEFTTVMIVATAALLSAPFWIGMISVARYLGFELANSAFPKVPAKNGAAVLDTSAAPRRLLVVTLQLAIVLLIGFPLLAVTQPFLPPFRGALVLLGVLLLLAISFWRGATNFQGHARAAAQVITEALARRTRDGRADVHAHADEASRILAGLGSPVSIQLESGSPAVGRTLAEIKLRGLTGATVLAIQRGEQALVVPSGDQRLLEGDVLAVAGTHESVKAARELLHGEVSSSSVS